MRPRRPAGVCARPLNFTVRSLMKYLSLVVAVWAIAWSIVQGEDIREPKCEPGAARLAECLDKALKTEDKRLNAVYILIMKMLAAGEVDPHAFFADKHEKLVAAERAWIQFRDAECATEEAMLTGASASGEVGVAYDCQLRMTRERTVYLEGVASSLRSNSKLCENDADACRVR